MLLHSPYIKAASPVSIVMLKVLLALCPAIAATVYFYGIGIVVQITLATLTAWLAEYVMLKLRAYSVAPFLLDGSVTVTAWLLALSFPPLAPWWLIVVACAFAVIVSKHLYGGLGNNIFNPAMVGYAIMIIAFPAEMSRFAAPWQLNTHSLSVVEELRYIFLGALPFPLHFDALASATPLNLLKTALLSHTDIPTLLKQAELSQWLSVNKWITLGYAVGGIFLFQQRLIPWQTPIGMMSGIGILAGALFLYDPSHYAIPWFHLFTGGTILGAFFIATDPVTSPTTPYGRFIYAFLIGLLTYVIRVFGHFPDGVAFAVLILNMAVPCIEKYTQPTVFGHQRKQS